jgi:hypothetical protein
MNTPPAAASVGHPLPFRARLEAAFGIDFAAVRVRAARLPAAVRGVAHGTHLHIAPGHERDAELLAHELTHVLQQTRRPVRTGPVALVRDAALEAEADLIARLAIDRPARAREEVRRRFGATAPTPGRVGWGVAQPNVHVEVGGRDTKLTDADAAMRLIQQGIARSPISRDFIRLRSRIQPVLKEWIKASRVLWKRYVTGRKERTVRYTSWEDLALALLGEVRSQSNLALETGLAQGVVINTYVKTQLVGYLVHVRAALNRPDFRKVKDRLLPAVGSYRRQYSHWYPSGGIKKILDHPGECEFKHLMAAVHDIEDAFSEGKDGDYGDVPGDKCVASVLVPNGAGGYDLEKRPLSDDDDRLTFRQGSLRDRDCTLTEQSEIIKSARDWGMPLEFGPSFTTGRSLQCCHCLCADTGQTGSEPVWLATIAWGLFAFWNVFYEKRFSRGHRFHEVMDMASNYGVPYSPFSYPLHGPRAGEPSPIGEVIG